MKIIQNKSLPFVAFIVLSISAFAQKPKSVTTTFWVAGVCGLCEEVIEKTMDTKGVIAADYTLETNKLTLTYNPKKITEQQIHQLLNNAGYDTEKSTASEDQYSKVHECCKYREQDKH
jgi:copper chaperone CopZ